jgi:hypothetical protein
MHVRHQLLWTYRPSFGRHEVSQQLKLGPGKRQILSITAGSAFVEIKN